MKRSVVFYFIITMFLGLSVVGQSEDKKINVLIVDGFSNHDWKQTTFVVKSILEKSELFHVSVSTAPSKPIDENWAMWQPNFKNYDVVVLNCNNIQNKEIKWPKSIEKELENYVSSGGGMYILHSANNAFSHWYEYNLMIGLGWRTPEDGVALQVTNDGKINEISKGEGKSTYHGPRNDEIIYKLNSHPINKDFPNAWKTPDMELYKFARGPAQNLTVLSYAKDDETLINWPVEWTVSYGKGNVYNSSMGHLWKGQAYPLSYRCVGFQTVLIRAVEWLATGKVSYQLPQNFPTEFKISLENKDLNK